MEPLNSMTDDIEKLLKIAESTDEPVTFEDTVVEKYIRENDIEAGDTRVPVYTIYYHYHAWHKNRKTRISRRDFFAQFKKHFPVVQIAEGYVYELNPEPFDLSREGYFKARALLRRERDGRKKRQQKKQSETS